MAQVGWLDPEAEHVRWTDGPADLEDLEELLDVALVKAQAWAPKPLPAGTVADPVPGNYRFAQRLLGRHLWARKQAGDGEGFGADGYMIQTYPLVREAYDAIRPKRGPLAGLL